MIGSAMDNLMKRNQQIIDALIKKADRVCPDSLALVGIYGSFCTGDIHKKSDLDLMVLINDDTGWRLATLFLQDDLQVGHDIYCTTWESLRQDACYPHPHISKLMDAKIVYCADKKHLVELENLRKDVETILSAPFSWADYRKAQQYLNEAQQIFARAMLFDDLTGIRIQAAELLAKVEDSLAMLNKRYFRYGVRRRLEELQAMAYKPDSIVSLVTAVVEADTIMQLKDSLTVLMRAIIGTFEAAQSQFTTEKQPVTPDAIRGTYEELFSNWRNKLYLAAACNDKHLSLMSLYGIHEMLTEIGEEIDIGQYDVMGCYDPQDLTKTAQNCDELLEEYLAQYHKAGIQANRYPDTDAFLKEYLK